MIIILMFTCHYLTIEPPTRCRSCFKNYEPTSTSLSTVSSKNLWPSQTMGWVWYLSHIWFHMVLHENEWLKKRWKHWFRWRSCWICWSWSSWARQTATTTSKQLKILQTSNRFEKNKQTSKYLFIKQTNLMTNKCFQVLRRALSDEHQALLCLKLCSEMEEVCFLI